MRFALFVALSALSVFLILTYVLIKYPHLGPNLWDAPSGAQEAATDTSLIASGTNSVDWRALQAAPGDWSWRDNGEQSIANFEAGQFVMTCSPKFAQVTLLRGAPAADGAIFDVWTTHENRRYKSRQGAKATAITIDANDDILDSIALSRGHFGIAVEGSEPMLIPSWSEVTRVIEDCRN